MKAYIGNPNIQRQGKKARENAAKRDVNTLPDPRTYSFVQGFLGTAPDETGFSALHPDAAGIRKAGEVGLSMSVLSALAPITKGMPVGGSIKSVGGKAAREAKIAKKVAAFEAGKKTGSIKAVKGKRVKVDPDFLRQMQAEQGQDAVLDFARADKHLKPDGAGGYVGAPRHVQSHQAKTQMRKEFDKQFSDGVNLLKQADPGRTGTWYDRAKSAQAMTNEPWQLPRSLEQHGVYSAGVSPETELAFALKHHNSRIQGGKARAYRGPGAKTLDSAVSENRPAKLAFKIGEYHDKNDPRLPNDGLFGVNDFRAAQSWGYTNKNKAGEMGPWQGGVTGTMHPVMDGETALAVSRANKAGVGGRTDWQGPHLQEVPWVLNKADDIYSRGKNARFKGPDGHNLALREANNTFEDYLYKHTASATHEAIPGKSTGHVPSLLGADDATKEAYTNAGRWDVEAPEVNGLLDDPLQAGIGAGRRDALYSAAGYRQLPSIRATGAYPNSAGQFETNPMTIARPLVDFPTGGGGQIAPDTLKSVSAIERARATWDAQEAGAANLPNTMAATKGKNSLVFDTRGIQGGNATTGVVPSGDQLEAAHRLLQAEGLDNSWGVTATSRGMSLFPFNPDMDAAAAGKVLRKIKPKMQAVVPGAQAQGARNSAPVYVPGIGKWGDDGIVPTAPFSGEATAGLLDEMVTAPPALARNLGEDEGVRSILRQKIARDAALPGARQDIQNMRSFFAEADWPKAVEMMRAGMKPAAALAALGYSLNSMAAEGE